MLPYVMAGIAAAGFISSAYGQYAGNKAAKKGQRADERQAELRIKQDRIASNEQALLDIEELGETLATQRAMMALRGGNPGMGSNLSITNKTMNTFNKDEQARQMSLQFGTQQARAQIAASRIALKGQRNQTYGNILGQGLNLLSTSDFGKSKSGLLSTDKTKNTPTKTYTSSTKGKL